MQHVLHLGGVYLHSTKLRQCPRRPRMARPLRPLRSCIYYMHILHAAPAAALRRRCAWCHGWPPPAGLGHTTPAASSAAPCHTAPHGARGLLWRLLLAARFGRGSFGLGQLRPPSWCMQVVTAQLERDSSTEAAGRTLAVAAGVLPGLLERQASRAGPAGHTAPRARARLGKWQSQVGLGSGGSLGRACPRAPCSRRAS